MQHTCSLSFSRSPPRASRGEIFHSKEGKSMEPARKALRAEEKSRFPDMLCRTGSLPHAAQRCFRRRSAAKDRAGKLKKAYRRRRHDNACVWEKAPCPAGKIPAKNTPGAWAWRAGAEKQVCPGVTHRCRMRLPTGPRRSAPKAPGGPRRTIKQRPGHSGPLFLHVMACRMQAQRPHAAEAAVTLYGA